MANCIQCGRKLPAFLFGRKICQWCVQHEAIQRGEEPANAIQPVMAAPWTRGSGNSMVLTQVFFGICVAVFIAMAFAKGSLDDPSSRELVHWGANVGPLTLGGQWWRLFTCLFVHIGIIHIAFNMWCLWDLGALCESLYGHWTFGAVYLISGLGASFASVLWRPEGVSAGASGAIFGLAGALISAFYLGEFSMPRAAISGSLRSVIAFVGYNLVFGAMIGHTDNAAHIGGLVTGLVLGALIAKVAPDGEQLFRRAGVLLIVVLVLSGGVLALQRSHGYWFHLQHAFELLDENQTDQAIAELQGIIRERSDYAPAHEELARAYTMKNEFPKAETEFKRALELKPGNNNASYGLGFTYLSENRPQEARETFTQLVARLPTSAGAHFGVGLANADEAKYQDAIQEYSAAVQLNPNFEGVYYRMGLAQAKLKNYDDAITAFHKEQENSADDYFIETALADAYRAKGMTKEADDATRKAAQLKSQR
ncbi:MAG TPA: rhomboid family intramembrane serine protease [Terriglobales bacterium]|jgi:rhomboid protease GluP|nr:rhomboid family intramembrane serine protease [Terriglobales bacterium]